jgi:glycosyltransferase involved in cell wall biosynthesis
MGDLQLTYFGILRAPTSWAKVGREMVEALVDVGAELNVFERKGFLYNPEISLPRTVLQRITQSFRDDVVFTFEHPANYHYLQGRYKVGLLTYESTVVPPRWIENARRFLDLLLLPSGFCRDLFVRAGLPSDRTRVLPYGYRPDTYYKNPPSVSARRETFRFLSVASPHKREGLDILLKAYARAFSACDDTVLVIKLNYLPKTKSKPFEQPELMRLIDDFRSQKDAPKISLIDSFLSETEMADLYRSASYFVSATRGEGFGMAFLEALACGLSIIVTGWGGHLDFLSSKNARLVKYRLVKANQIQYDCQDTRALIAEPDLADLADHMRSVYDERQSGTTPKTDNRDSVLEGYTWTRIAQRFIDMIQR